jgi:hypothetical protein
MTVRIITDSNGRKHITNEPLLHPPQRTWVGLTYEDMVALQKELFDKKGEMVLPTTFARAIEAKLKEKNNASP